MSWGRSQRSSSRRNADWQDYEREKRAWLEKNPAATPEEYDRAMRVIVDKLGL